MVMSRVLKHLERGSCQGRLQRGSNIEAGYWRPSRHEHQKNCTTRLQLGNREVIFVKTLAAQQRNPVKLAEEECDYRSPADNLHTQKRKRSAVGLCEAPNQEIRDVNLSDGHKDSDPPHSVHLLHSSGFLRFPPHLSVYLVLTIPYPCLISGPGLLRHQLQGQFSMTFQVKYPSSWGYTWLNLSGLSFQWRRAGSNNKTCCLAEGSIRPKQHHLGTCGIMREAEVFYPNTVWLWDIESCRLDHGSAGVWQQLGGDASQCDNTE